MTLCAAALVAVSTSSCSSAQEPPRAQQRSEVRPATGTPPAGGGGTPTTVAGPGGAAEGDDRAFPERWRPEPLAWRSCPEVPPGECATLRVPLDWSQPEGATVELVLGRLGARRDRIGALVTNPGGPGGSGLRFLAGEPLGPAVRDRFDVVSWDPRGVGASEPLACDGPVPALAAADPDPDDPTERAALEDAAAAVAAACGARHPELLAHLDTLTTAFDLEAIRRALGDAPLNYLGYSYGSHIGLRYLDRFPTRVRAMVLDGVVDPEQGFEEFLLGQTAAFEASFARQARRCADDTARCGVPDLAAAYDELADRVELAPLSAPAGPVGPSELAIAALASAYRADGWSRLGAALAEGLAGDGTRLRALADAYFDMAGYPAYAGVVCTDSPPPEGPRAYAAFAERARELSPRFGGSIANELLPCATWPVPARGGPARVEAPGAPPVLVVGNTGDPATPLANASRVAANLRASVLVTVESDGHTAVGSDDCVDRLVEAYLVDLVVPGTDQRCA